MMSHPAKALSSEGLARRRYNHGAGGQGRNQDTENTRLQEEGRRTGDRMPLLSFTASSWRRPAPWMMHPRDDSSINTINEDETIRTEHGDQSSQTLVDISTTTTHPSASSGTIRSTEDETYKKKNDTDGNVLSITHRQRVQAILEAALKVVEEGDDCTGNGRRGCDG